MVKVRNATATMMPCTKQKRHENNDSNNGNNGILTSDVINCGNKQPTNNSNNNNEKNTNINATAAINSRKQIWQLEQHIVSSLVQVEPDPPKDMSFALNNNNDNNDFFHVVRDDHNDIFSFSSKPELYGGVDVSFPENDQDRSVAVYVIIDKRTMEVVYHDYEYFHLQVPYIPSFLAFREIEPLELLIRRQMAKQPHLTPLAILVDGNGILHPRHAGIACFVGTRTGIPTIGVGKTLYYEGGYTRERIGMEVDEFLQQVKNVVTDNPNVAHMLSKYRGLVIQNKSLPANNENDNNDNYSTSAMDGVSSTSSTATTASPDSSDTSTTSDIQMTTNTHGMSAIEVNDNDEQNEGATDANNKKQEHQQVQQPPPPLAVATVAMTAKQQQGMDRAKILHDLAPFANGFAIPMLNNNNNDNSSSSSSSSASKYPVLACALVGHGGQIAASSKVKAIAGTRNPIYVSIGHAISMQKAVQICASLSLARIPEPVRQADLLGRNLLRKRPFPNNN